MKEGFYKEPFENTVTCLKQQTYTLHQKIYTQITGAIKAKLSEAYENSSKTDNNFVISDLKSEIQKNNDILIEYKDTVNDINLLLEQLKVWERKLLNCDNVKQAEEVEQQLKKYYDIEINKINSGLEKASEKVMEKIGAFLKVQNPAAINEVKDSDNINNYSITQESDQAIIEKEQQQMELKKLTEQNTKLKSLNTSLIEELEVSKDEKYWKEKAENLKTKNSQLKSEVLSLKDNQNTNDDIVKVYELGCIEEQINTPIIGDNENALPIEDSYI